MIDLLNATRARPSARTGRPARDASERRKKVSFYCLIRIVKIEFAIVSSGGPTPPRPTNPESGMSFQEAVRPQKPKGMCHRSLPRFALIDCAWALAPRRNTGIFGNVSNDNKMKQDSYTRWLPPFTREELDDFKAALYSVNVSNRCCNPGHPSWAEGYQRSHQRCLAAREDEDIRV